VLEILNATQKYLTVWIVLSVCLSLVAGCTASPTAPSSPNGGELATYQMEIDLLGAKHEASVDKEGRLKTSVQTMSADGTISLSIDKNTTLLDKDGKPPQFIRVAINPTLPLPPEGAYIVGEVYILTPQGATFDPPLKLTINYNPEELPEGVRENDIYIAPYDESAGWGMSYYRRVDTENHRVTTQVNYFAKYAVLASREPPEPPPPPDLAAIPLEQALSSGKPTLAEFGSNKCIPCKMMKPILENLAIIYEDKLNVVIVEVYERMSLARQYKIMTIPTQILFDENGQEIYRHIGLWKMEEIEIKLREMGVE